ncbi:Insulin-degrading enzyme [Seminavis robusta]|uniref:Insulin-degrading enzyme n=1 Tax=Seminavis robusta TaxID=568900 RepID=A0A9N8E7R6_9STRA|nr:Insulin-degrading enzyme [Seminavis robusta]|eukprot:Sro773_g200540.1 Insulin-degrading enzyme (929) ;mRNA; r:41684-44819
MRYFPYGYRYLATLLFLGNYTTGLSLSRRQGLWRSISGNNLTRFAAKDSNDGSDEDIHTSLSRRELLQWGPLLAAALSSDIGLSPVFDDYPNQNANAAVPSEQAATVMRQQVPFSSLRQYKSVTLSNGLRVLLVNDKSAVRGGVAIKVSGGGQFSDPKELPGCAHLMEHMVLSSKSSSRFRKSLDFEEWLIDKEGASNAFTGYEQVCFHFNLPSTPTVLMEEALTRFASHFNEAEVNKVCRNDDVLKREIRRVNAELDFDNESIQSFYLVKGMMNPEHPYAKFARGNIDTLERMPKEAGINVGSRLFEFFKEFYQPTNSFLVVVGPYELSSMERWVSPFSSALSRQPWQSSAPRLFPSPLKADRRMRQILLYRPKVDSPLREGIETLSMHWTLELDYTADAANRFGSNTVTATQVGFVISQILGRRGPGSLYYILYRRGWLPNGMQGLPRISFPVDVSGFQLMKLDIGLTVEGFVNRAVVVADVIRTINTVFSGAAMTKFLVSREILSQYAVVAQLHGFVLAPRPSDAVELAVDGLPAASGRKDVDPCEWSRFPLPYGLSDLLALQKVVKETLVKMSDPSNAIVITTATDKSLKKAKDTRILGETVPFVAPAKWTTAPLTRAKCYRDDLFQFTGIVGELFTASIQEDELLPPLVNNLIPPMLRSPRLPLSQKGIDLNEGRNENWRVLTSTAFILRIPTMAPEKSCRCAFVFQLLSPRPARANTRQAAYAELWKISFEKAVVDLAELGAPAGLAYDMSFNKYGMRLCFLGISQNLPSYSRRFCRRLVQHHKDLLAGPEVLDKAITETAVYNAGRRRGPSALRKREIERVIRETSAYEAATEAIAFYKSVNGGCCFSQGDLLPFEVSSLFNDLQSIFNGELGTKGKSETTTSMPVADDLAYTPVWKPRFGSSCSIPGVPLLSDACGRVPR